MEDVDQYYTIVLAKGLRGQQGGSDILRTGALGRLKDAFENIEYYDRNDPEVDADCKDNVGQPATISSFQTSGLRKLRKRIVVVFDRSFGESSYCRTHR